MTATVSYKGSTLATVSNTTKTLDTQGTYLEDDITIADVTAVATLITKSITANGTYNASSDSADGYSSVTVNVSGGGGLVYETGTYTPATDDSHPSISFTGTHTDRPFLVLLVDTGTSAPSDNSNLFWFVVSFYDVFNYVQYTNRCYGRVMGGYKSTDLSTVAYNLTEINGSTATTLSYHLSNTEFKPYVGSVHRYFRSSRTYKWIAVWKPSA